MTWKVVRYFWYLHMVPSTYWNPMYVCRMSMEMRPASTRGSAEPAAKGMAVKGTSAIETALWNN
jgi:hypothetical protein